MPPAPPPPSIPREYSPFDRVLMGMQRNLARFTEPLKAPKVPYPADGLPDSPLDEAARRHAAGLMRVNHAGEVSAQALYHGQALMAKDSRVRAHLLKAAEEERQHLHWCEQRLTELDESPSLLRPLWYAGSFAMGAAAGLAGDRWNLGFVEETEKQVAAHLGDHLRQLPVADDRSRAIVSAMMADETRHGQEAAAAGAKSLPRPVRRAMSLISELMKFGAYRL